MSHALYRWLLLVENATKLYHGSRSVFRQGTVLTPQRRGYAFGTGEDRVGKRVRKWCEHYLELYRPSNAVPRQSAVFLVDDPEMIEKVGGYDDHIYAVIPHGATTRCNLHWYGEMEGYCFHIFGDGNHPEWADEAEVKRIAHGYWYATTNDANEPHRNHIEYLAHSATVVEIIR